jgi:hypothetical protein
MRPKGLRKILNSDLQQKGYLSIDEVHAIAKSEGHKESNGERRLRPSESPYAKPIYNPFPPRNITGYRWIGPKSEKVQIMQFPQQSIFSQQIISK